MRMPFDSKILGKRINELRKRDSIQQEKLAEALEKSVPMISYYESGKRVPPPDVLFVMCQIFRVSSDYLLGLTDNPEPKCDIPKEYIPPDYARLKAIEAELEKIDLARIIEIERLMRKG